MRVIQLYHPPSTFLFYLDLLKLHSYILKQDNFLRGSGGGSLVTDLGVMYSSTLMRVKETDGV